MHVSHPKSPHLSISGVDYIAGTRHCIVCIEAVCNHHDALKSHYLTNWKHMLWRETQPIMATTETGHTIEGMIAVPGRKVLANFDQLNCVLYCTECFPGHTLAGCGGCGEEVDRTEEHSKCEILEKLESGVNRNFRIVYWHIDCLPDDFRFVKENSQTIPKE